MRSRKLRIAWSVGCGIVAVLLMALWVRSYWWGYSVGGYTHDGTNIRSMFKCELETGRVTLTATPGLSAIFTANLWQQRTYPRHVLARDDTYGFMGFYRSESEWCVPVWFVAVLAATLAPAPWLRWRFTLRTLLIATALIAAVLGLIVYAVR